jgi:hypothetical protein
MLSTAAVVAEAVVAAAMIVATHFVLEGSRNVDQGYRYMRDEVRLYARNAVAAMEDAGWNSGFRYVTNQLAVRSLAQYCLTPKLASPHLHHLTSAFSLWLWKASRISNGVQLFLRRCSRRDTKQCCCAVARDGA